METPSPKEIIESVLAKLGLRASAIHENVDAERRRRNFAIFLSEEDARFFHPHLEEIFALERIVRLMLHRCGSDEVIEIDVAGFRSSRDEKLRELVRSAAREVIRTGRSIALHPMSGRERRVAHLELSSHPEVRTESIDEGKSRRVVIHPLVSK